MAINMLNEALSNHFGYPVFKPSQQPLVQAIADGHSVLGILPTGEGKSVCFQIPAIIKPGITIVVSPLLALIHDQVSALQERGIGALAITSATSFDERARIFDRLFKGDAQLLYVAPELFARSDFLAKFGYNTPIRTVVFDEAHCLSQWGQDFRPSYVRAAHLTATLSKRYTQKGLPAVQRVAVTATATRKIQANICDLLGIRAEHIIRGDLRRRNLRLNVHPVDGNQNRTTLLISLVQTYAKTNQPTIVYAHTRATVDSLVRSLRVVGINAVAFHAGLSVEDKATAQQRFNDDSVSVVVATIAFGMGVDKPNIRAVIHFNAPHSIEDYYQQIGRAGRDGYPSDCHLLFNQANEMDHVIEIMDTTTPSSYELQRGYAFMHEMYATQGQAIRVQNETLAGAIGVPPSKSKRIIEQLARFNIIKALGGNDYAVRTLSNTRVFNAMDVVNEGRRRAIQVMLEFGNDKHCLMQFIMDYFGQHGTGACGNCCNCKAQSARGIDASNPTGAIRANPVYQDLVALRTRIGRTLKVPNFAIMSDAAIKKIATNLLHEVDDLVEAGMSKLHAKVYVAEIRAIVLRDEMAADSDRAPAPQSAVPTHADSVDVERAGGLNPLNR